MSGGAFGNCKRCDRLIVACVCAPDTQPAPASGEGEVLSPGVVSVTPGGIVMTITERPASEDGEALEEARAWRDNYDGMFWRWAECDAERLRLADALRHAEMRLRIAEQNAALGGEQAGDD